MFSLSNIVKAPSTAEPPAHHVLYLPDPPKSSGWAGFFPSRNSPQHDDHGLTAQSAGVTQDETDIAGFRNPWPSWHKHTRAELLQSLQWGEQNDGCVELAASHLPDSPTPPHKPDEKHRPRFGDINDWPNSPGAKAAQLLQVETPDFSFPSGSKAKATWLGHAGVLVQLPPLDSPRGRPVTILFDPLFSSRASPNNFVGPVRSYPPPCTIEDLPPIHIVAISHNHFDHMSAEALISIFNQNLKTVRFFVPLGNKHFLVSWGIPEDRIIELDWWDSVQLNAPTLSSTASLKIHCAPAQHNSFRSSGDTNLALWSSWYIEYLPSDPHHVQDPKPYRVLFGGDTGYQFHPSPAWPPSPANPSPDIPAEDEITYPPCPAFAEIRDRIGPPDMLLLPISVGATFSYLRSFVPLPNWVNPFPRHTAGVTGANHMPAWDAVKVMREMVGARPGGESNTGDEGGVEPGKEAVAMGIHWGTFVPDPEEVLHTLGSLEWACQQQGVKFVRELVEEGADREEGGRGLRFAAVNHGGSVCI